MKILMYEIKASSIVLNHTSQRDPTTDNSYVHFTFSLRIGEPFPSLGHCLFLFLRCSELLYYDFISWYPLMKMLLQIIAHSTHNCEGNILRTKCVVPDYIVAWLDSNLWTKFKT